MDFIITPGRIFYCSDGELLAEITFPIQPDGVAEINHTFVSPSLRGQGVAGKLMEAAVDVIRQSGCKARASCSYAIQWLDRHPECADILE